MVDREDDAASSAGVFGGVLVFEDGRSFEAAPSEVRALLVDSPDISLKVRASAELVRFRAADDRIEYAADLTGLLPIAAAGLSTPDVVAVMARVASVLAAMHAAGQSHGDLGPWSVRVGRGRVVLLAPPPGVPAGALIAARIRHTGAPLSDAAFCSGATLAGREGGPANDVFALAGLTYGLVSGDLPVGHVDLSAAARSHMRDLAMMVSAGLAAAPAQRPPMAVFESTLWKTVRAGPATRWAVAPAPDGSPAAEAEDAVPVDEPANVPAGAESNVPVDEASNVPVQQPPNVPVDAAARRPFGTRPHPVQAAWTPPGAPPRAEGKQLSTVLTLLLVVGGLFVLVGALWVVAVGWAILGEGGRAGLLVALTVGIAMGGFALEKKGYRSSGFALVVLASQMLWADGGYVLNLADALGSAGAWATVAAFVTAVSALLAQRRKSIGVGVLAALGFSVFAVCFNVATGRPGQLAFFSALTLALLLGGLLAQRRERPMTATALLVTGSQLLWIDAGCFLDLVDGADSAGPWTAAAAAVFAVALAVAYARKSIAAGFVAALDFLVFASLFAYVTGRPGQLGMAVTITIIAAVLGVQQARKGREFLGAALVLGATQALWADAALFLDFAGVSGQLGAWVLSAAVVLAVTYAVTLRRHPTGAILAALDAAVFASCLGAYLSHGEPVGPPVYSLFVAWLYVALAGGAHLAKRPAASALFAGFGLFSAFASALMGVRLMSSEENLVFGALWPIAAIASVLPFAFRGAPAHRALGRVGVAVLLAAVPAAEAFQRPNDPAFIVIAAVVGVAAAIAALRVPTWTVQLAGAVIGTLNAVLIPSAMFLDKCMSEGGMDVLQGPNALYLLAALGAPVALLVAAAFSRPDPTHKAGYRFVEVAALLQLFGLLTLASLVRSSDFFYPGLLLLTGTFALALGVARKHVVIVAIASGALLLNLWIQYFQKLRDTFPTAVLVIGFGIGLLLAGVIYERKLRHVLPRLKEWS